MEFHKCKSVVKEDDWRSGELPASKSTESWKGRAIFRILAGGIASRTSVPAKVCDPIRRKKGSPEDLLAKVSLNTAQREREQSEALHMERHRSEGEFAPREAFHRERNPRYQLLLYLLRMTLIFKISIPLFLETSLSSWRHGKGSTKSSRESSSLEPRRLALPLPGQEVSRASPQYQRMLEKLNNDVEL